MKKPFLNRKERDEIYNDTMMGAELWLKFIIKRSLKNIHEKEGCFQYLIAKNTIIKTQLINNEGFNKME